MSTAVGTRASTYPMWGMLARFLLLAIVLGSLTMREGKQLTAALLPFFGAEIHWLDDSLRVDGLDIVEDNGERVIRLHVGLARPVTVDGVMFSPDPRGTAVSSTLVGNLTLPTILLLSSAFAFPCRYAFACVRRALWTLPPLMLLWTLGVPFVLWGGVWGLFVRAANLPGPTPLLLWSEFVSGGGQLAIALALGSGVAYWTSARAP